MYSADFGRSSPSKGKMSYKETMDDIMPKPILSAICLPGQILFRNLVDLSFVVMKRETNEPRTKSKD